MAVTFDGPNKIIICETNTLILDIRDMYSRWKDWILQGDNSKYLPAFRVVGGDPVDESNGIYVTSYFFLLNGWRIRPQEANHKLIAYNGILVVDGGGDPFIHTLGNYNVMIQYSQPVKSETVSISGSSGGLTTEEHNQLMSTAKEETLQRALGLMMENHVEDDIIRNEDGNKTSSKFYLYSSKSAAETHNKTTGLIAIYTVSITYDIDGLMTLFKVTKD